MKEAWMFATVRSFVLDKKRMSRLTEGLGELFAQGNGAGVTPASPFIRDYHREYAGLAELEAAHGEIRYECEALLRIRHRLVNVENLAGKYTSGGIHAIAWKAFMFKSHRFIESNCALAPRTAALLRNVPGLYTAFFSILEGGQYITPHWGYWKGFLRYHLAVIIPGNNADRSCWLRVNASPEDNAAHDLTRIERGQKYYWKEGEGVMFDDTFLHDAKNESEAVRVVLWLDLRRKLPPLLNAINTAVLEIAHRAPAIAAVRKNAVVRLG
jgi:beta-hydroxylase